MIGVSNLSKEQAAEILIDINAVNISFTQPFKYSSGIFSPIYTNCRIIASHSEERDLIINTMINNIELLNEEIDVVASAGISSIFLASLIAQRLEIPMIYVRTGKKSHGKGKERHIEYW